MSTSYDFFIVSGLACLSFLILVVLLRVGSDPYPISRICKLHVKGVILYLLYSSALIIYFPERTMFSVERIQEWLVGLFFYFLFFYGFFFHFFTQIIRGFSLNILVGILKKNEKVSFVELKQLFDSGKGIEAVRHERVEVMKLAGTIRERNGRLELLRMGRFAVQMNRLLFVIFKFNYLGKSDG